MMKKFSRTKLQIYFRYQVRLDVHFNEVHSSGNRVRYEFTFIVFGRYLITVGLKYNWNIRQARRLRSHKRLLGVELYDVCSPPGVSFECLL